MIADEQLWAHNMDLNHNTPLLETKRSILKSKAYEEDFDSLVDKEPECDGQVYRGIILSLISGLCFSLSSVIVKFLDNIHPGALALSRFAGVLLLSLPHVVCDSGNPFGPREVRHFLIMRGVAGATSTFLRFYAFQYLPLVEATVIIFSAPLFVAIFGRIFLKEACSVIQVVAIMTTLLGLVFTVKVPLMFFSSHSPVLAVMANSTDMNATVSGLLSNETYRAPLNSTSISSESEDPTSNILGIVAALTSNLFIAGVFTFIRKAKNVHHGTIMFNLGWVAVLEMLVITGAMNGFTMPTTNLEWLLMAVLGLLAYAGQTLLTLALQAEQAGPVALIRSAADIVLSFVWQIWLFGQVPDLWEIGGALLVTSSIVAISVRKWVVSLADGSAVKKKLHFLTH